ncbi:ATP synthase subunit e, mitochondrial-like [Onthophagus taurus]|uniref:ATP synthase subunit e, mitochondrial-like n=1 Tax=Onthophagus taurus TaxID=166361 RepID=UPI000C20768C|nr:ATP synthase subunit e, mitochondrial-like [Onthophagus taurus]
MSALPAPVRVSPVIKFFRWSLLGAGVLYGGFHQSRLTKKENALREIEAKQKVIRDEKLAIERKERAEKEIKELEALMAPAK